MDRWGSVGIDLGGTKLLAVLFDSSFKPVEQILHRTEPQKGLERFARRLVGAVAQLAKSARRRGLTLRAAGAGCAGFVDAEAGVLTSCPNIPFIRDFPISRQIAAVARCSVRAGNDVLLALAATAHAARGGSDFSQRGRPIRDIRFEIHDVFDPDAPGESKTLFLAANAAHARTKQAVIERELLFGLGDRYDPALVAESERRLRRLGFLRKVEVIGVPSADGPVVVVRTWDSWTLEPIAHFERSGGVNDTRFGLADRNILGYGKSLSASWSNAGGSVHRALSYRDYQLFRTRVEAQLSAGQGAQDRHVDLTVGRPFYASIARDSVLGRAGWREDRTAVYQGLSEAGTVGRRAYAFGAGYGYAFEASTWRARRVTAGLFHEHASYVGLADAPTAFVPDLERRSGIELALEYQDNDFVKLRRIQKLSRDEDFNLGLGLAARAAYAPRWAAVGTTGERLEPRLSLRRGFASELGQLLMLAADYSSTYENGGNGLRVATLDAQYFCRYFPRHTAVARVAFDHGWRLDRPRQLSLGEDNGLRGYRASQFTGNRRLVINAENRVFLFDNWLKLIDAGGVLFFDSGYAWGAEQRFALSDLKSSFGFGLRLAPTRSAGNDPVRIDLARAFDDNRFSSRWTISIKAGHTFGPR